MTLNDSVKNGWRTAEEAQSIMDNTTEKGVLSYASDRFKRGEIIDGQDFIDDFRSGSVDSEIPTEYFGTNRDKVADRMEYLLDTEKRYLKNKASTKAKFDNDEAKALTKVLELKQLLTQAKE